MVRSGYVLAGFETLAGIVNNFINNTKGRYNNNFSRKDVSNFLSKTCSGFLHSYGQNFPNRRNYSKYNKVEASLFQRSRDYGLFDDSEFFVDSGGFQISIGRLNREESKLLLKMYYDFLREYHHVLDRAFVLDTPPGPGCTAFDNFEDVWKWNLDSYMEASNLPQEIRDKIIYIHHFRTPKLWEIFSDILRDHNMFSRFKYHGTGGVVANISGDMSIPCVIYVLPLIPLLNECKKVNRDHLDFHILGGSSFRDILFYELFQLHVLKKHGIKLDITFDSSGLFKGLMVGRFIQILDGDIMRKVDIRSLKLDKRIGTETRARVMYKEKMDELASKYSFKPIVMDEVYNSKTGTFFEEVKVYTMFYMLDQFLEVRNMLREIVQKVYLLYEAGNISEFIGSLIDITKNLNNGKITRKQKAKAHSVSKSLDMLTNLDEEYCEYVVKKFLAKDEFVNLDSDRKVILWG